MNTLKIGQHCPVHKGIYAGVARSFSSEPDNHIWLLDAKSPEEYMNWTDAMEWAESLGEAIDLPTRYEAALLGCNLAEELGDYGYVWTSTSEGVRSAWLQLWYSSRPNSQGTAGKTNTIHVRAVKRLPVTYEMKGHPLATPAQAVDAPGAPCEPSITLDFKMATELLKMFGEEPGLVTLQHGSERSHSGTGLYALYSHLPEEGAEFLGAEPDNKAMPEAAADVTAAPAQAGEYPELPERPEPDGFLTIEIIGRNVEINAYRDSTMEAYAYASIDADRAARRAAQAAPVDANVQQDAERYRWLREYAIGAYTSVFRGKSSAAVYLLTRVPALDGIGEETDTAIDAARAAQRDVV